MNKVIIAGGGTGGHIFPAIAIANALLATKKEIEILFVGAKGKMEMEKIPQAGYNIIGIDIAGFNRNSLIKNIALPLKLAKSFLQVRTIFKQFKPNIVIGVGGYSSFPVVKFAQQKSIPTFIHESNSFAGKSNIILGKKATAVFVANDGMGKFFPSKKIILSGNPIRKSIVDSKINKEEAIRNFSLEKDLQTVLIVGGSLGAKSINQCISSQLIEFKNNNIQLIWQTGKVNIDEYKAKAIGNNNVWVGEFIKEMEIAYAAADIVISRAGAMAVSELCIVKKPVIFVPFPHAAEDHQTANAMYLVNKNAALIIKDENVNQDLVKSVIALCKNLEKQNELKENIKKLGISNASETIANEILKYLN